MSRPCGHINYMWACKTCLSAYAREREKTRSQVPIWTELARKVWRLS
jgi:hypothetical protein